MGRKKDRADIGKHRGPGRKTKKQGEPDLPEHVKKYIENGKLKYKKLILSSLNLKSESPVQCCRGCGIRQ